MAKIFLFFSFYCLFIFPEFCITFFPLQILAFGLVFSKTAVDVLNIIHRPQLPEKIKWCHPILQRRYSPIVDVVINKIVPLCSKLVGGLGSSYVIFGGGYKALNGIDAIDPIRQYILTKYHGFPIGFKWDEPTVIAWRRFSTTAAAQSINMEERISIFIDKNKEFSETIDKLSKEIIAKNLPKEK